MSVKEEDWWVEDFLDAVEEAEKLREELNEKGFDDGKVL